MTVFICKRDTLLENWTDEIMYILENTPNDLEGIETVFEFHIIQTSKQSKSP